jgi:hypothetical protein
MKIMFVMGNPDPKKHSTRFDFVEFEPVAGGAPESSLEKFKPSFYIPKPFAASANRIRVTIEELP